MILTRKEILNAINNKDIIIAPYDEDKLNPNSYNVTLNRELEIYTPDVLDMKSTNNTKRIIIPKSGLTLLPGKVYLGRTNEYTETKKYVPMLEGRSSIGRLGMGIHITAGFGDVGFKGFWTLEIYVIQPLIIYPNVEIGQLYYHDIKDPNDVELYHGKYQNNKGIQASMLYKEF